jgi:hypothetical protein
MNHGFASSHFAMAESIDDSTGKLATSALLVRVAQELESIEGLTDADILNIVVSPSQSIDGDQEMEASVYYSLDAD